MIGAGSVPEHERSLGDALEHVLSELALALNGRQVDDLLAFVGLIEQWNRTYNLTSIREPSAMLTHHLADCLAVVGPLRRRSAAVLGGGRLLDVGSGAGLPGVVLAIAQPATTVVCVDSVGKKAAFIAHAAATLGLANLSAMHARVESLDEARFDVIASRAFASLSDMARSTQQLLAADGWWMAMKGDPADVELQAARRIALGFHVEPLRIPGLSAKRCIVWMQHESIHSLSKSTNA